MRRPLQTIHLLVTKPEHWPYKEAEHLVGWSLMLARPIQWVIDEWAETKTTCLATRRLSTTGCGGGGQETVWASLTIGRLSWDNLVRSLTSQGVLKKNYLISDYNIDLFCLTETKLCQDDYVSLNESTPPSHINAQIPWDTDRRGGVTTISNSAILINLKSKLNYNIYS